MALNHVDLELVTNLYLKPAQFKDAKEFDDYIASSSYKTGPVEDYVSVDNPGVCIGL